MKRDAPLDTYLRMYRRRTGLTQSELGYLIGKVGPVLCAKHERGNRLPVLLTALAYEAALGVPLSAIYEGLYCRVRESVLLRAEGLRVRVTRTTATKQRERKLAYLASLIDSAGDSSSSTP